MSNATSAKNNTHLTPGTQLFNFDRKLITVKPYYISNNVS